MVICAKMAEPIKMPFGLWARMGSRNHVLGGGSTGAKVMLPWQPIFGFRWAIILVV